jgi:hypothetical protein
MSQEGTQERKPCLDPTDRYLKRRIPSLGEEEEIVKEVPDAEAGRRLLRSWSCRRLLPAKFYGEDIAVKYKHT